MHADHCDTEHDELLALARRAEDAARAHDRRALLTASRHFLTALASHLDGERVERRLLDDAVREGRARDEQEVVEEFVNLVRAAVHGSGAKCHCDRLARVATTRLRDLIEVEASARDLRELR